MPPDPSDPASRDGPAARRRVPPIVWIVVIVAAAVATWFAAVWIVDFVIRANRTAG